MEWLRQQEQDAADKVKVALAKPLCLDDVPDSSEFDPWEIFPCFYGSYSKEFDDVALAVLRNLKIGRDGYREEQTPEALPHHMFREVLCTSNLCDYGTSPRVCFTNEPFGVVLDGLIDKWEAHSAIRWDNNRST